MEIEPLQAKSQLHSDLMGAETGCGLEPLVLWLQRGKPPLSC